VYEGNATYAGAFAAIMANVVLIGYIIVAVMEEDDTKKGKIDQASSGKKSD
jgi:vacuolar ATPase assembly integral membrane protein VMA21